MSMDEYEYRAYHTVQSMANNKEVHERFVRVRAGLEYVGCTREQLMQIATLAFAQLTREQHPDISSEELQRTVESELSAFMWLMDNV